MNWRANTRRNPAIIVLGCIAFASVALAACGGGANGATSKTPATTMPPMASMAPAAGAASAPAVASSNVTITNFAFSPSTIRVKVGTTVTWRNTDEEPHTVFSSDAGMKSGTLAGTSNTYSFTFATPGRFTYHCTIHPFMHGTVEVTQ